MPTKAYIEDLFAEEETQLLEIAGILVQNDGKIPGKYWIWMDIRSGERAIVRIDARVMPDQSSWLDRLEAGAPVSGRKFFMGYHNINAGENKLPPLPLYIEGDGDAPGALVQFKVKSRGSPGLTFTSSCMIGSDI